MLFSIQSITLFAQKEQTLCEVTVKGIKLERFMVGLKVQELDSATLARFRFSTAAEFLQFQAPVSFKSYGAGQVSSISFRGTSASHTAVLWNGLNINFPSLGQSDFSVLPMTGFDQMSIQYGSSASCIGTDAVGGSIILRSSPNLKLNAGQLQIANRIESSQNYSSQIGFRFNQKLNKKWIFSSKSMLYGSVFNHIFRQNEAKTRRGEVYGFEPVLVNQKGLIQDLYLTKDNGNSLSINAWLTDNNTMIQPEKIDLKEILRTQAFRFVGAYQLNKTLFRAGFIKDITEYGKSENLNPSRTEINRYTFRTEHDFSWIQSCDKGTNLKIGAEIAYFDALVDGYGSVRKTEQRADFYALLRHQFNSKLTTSVNLRQAFVLGFNPPFTPSLGIDYQAFNLKNTRISFPVNIGLSYRVPTLNERFWLKLGNPDIQPEKGFNKEVGVVLKHRFNKNTQNVLQANAFHNMIFNWTYWNPAKNYRVENLQQVLAKGIEIDWKLSKKINSFTLDASLGYALTHSSQQIEFGPYTKDLIGKQLIYVPRHTVSSNATLGSQAFSVTIQQQFQSKRYVTFDHSGQAFAPFYTANAVINRSFTAKKHLFNCAFQVNNITNTVYPTLKKNAMPLRTAAINLVYNFQSK